MAMQLKKVAIISGMLLSVAAISLPMPRWVQAVMRAKCTKWV